MNRSEQTKRGIAEARAAGVEWGRHGPVQAKRNRADADAFAEEMRPVLVKLMMHDSRQATRAARELNRLGVPTRCGGGWHPVTVRRVVKRLGPSFDDDLRRRRDAVFKKNFGVPPPACPPGPGVGAPEPGAPEGGPSADDQAPGDTWSVDQALDVDEMPVTYLRGGEPTPGRATNPRVLVVGGA